MAPTPGASLTRGMPASARAAAGPMPDSISSWGLTAVPAHSSSSPPGASSATEQYRAVQGRTGQDRAGQGRTGWGSNHVGVRLSLCWCLRVLPCRKSFKCSCCAASLRHVASPQFTIQNSTAVVQAVGAWATRRSGTTSETPLKARQEHSTGCTRKVTHLLL